MNEKLDPLSPLGRRVLNELQDRETAAPGEVPKPPVNLVYLKSLGHVAGNPFYESPEDPKAA